MSPPPTQHAQLPLQAYTALNTYFTTHAHLTPEIEVLPPALEPTDALILEDGANLGVPKKILALAFMHARHLFFAHHISDIKDEWRKALEATRVMLLFDPEHLTAANYRKRHLLDLQSSGVFPEALWAECRFMNSILTSPLHRQSKSPTLWAHRAWWMGLIVPYLSKSEYVAFFTAELDAAIKAGERHPKNYYAWQYARRVVEKMGKTLPSSEREDFLVSSAQKISRWCLLHVSDISGFSFLMWVLGLMRSMNESGRVVQEVVAYAVDLTLANESPWTFVRTMLASGLVEEGEKRDMVRAMDKCRKDNERNGESTLFRARLGETLYWIKENEVEDDTPGTQEGVRDAKQSENLIYNRSKHGS